MVLVLSKFCGLYVEQPKRVLTTSFDPAELNEEENSHIWIANSPCRGLEADVAYCHRIQTTKGSDVIRAVLKIQSQLQEFAKQSWLEDSIHRQGGILLSEQYHRLACPRAKFAQLVALGDALVVSDVDTAEPLAASPRKVHASDYSMS